jgi:hypothetical protein
MQFYSPVPLKDCGETDYTRYIMFILIHISQFSQSHHINGAVYFKVQSRYLSEGLGPQSG